MVCVLSCLILSGKIGGYSLLRYCERTPVAPYRFYLLDLPQRTGGTPERRGIGESVEDHFCQRG